jgi:hypothetical protein|tara:strand:+ start:1070 stop:1252 length:183 start_codon:yes stop_codon:yes gene_type:complete
MVMTVKDKLIEIQTHLEDMSMSIEYITDVRNELSDYLLTLNYEHKYIEGLLNGTIESLEK